MHAAYEVISQFNPSSTYFCSTFSCPSLPISLSKSLINLGSSLHCLGSADGHLICSASLRITSYCDWVENCHVEINISAEWECRD